MGIEAKLLDLVQEKFGKLSEAEIKLFTAVANGEEADYRSGNKELDDVEKADKWGDGRALKAEKIKWLCTNKSASEFITHSGVVAWGVCVEGELYLQFAEMGFLLAFFECSFDETIYLQYAQIRVLHLGGTHTGRIEADSLDVKGSVFLSNGFKAKSGVRLGSATIGGNLECDNGEFIKPRESIDPDGRALFADGINVKGDVFLRNGFKAEGEVRLPGANIGGTLDCKEGEFINPGGCALFADGINVKSTVLLRGGFKAKGEVRLPSATIGGNLDCSNGPKKETKGGEFINPEGRTLFADGLNVKGSVFLINGFKAEGKICLESAIINNNFVYTGVESPEKAILSLRSAKIGVLWDQKESWPKKGNLYLH